MKKLALLFLVSLISFSFSAFAGESLGADNCLATQSSQARFADNGFEFDQSFDGSEQANDVNVVEE